MPLEKKTRITKPRPERRGGATGDPIARFSDLVHLIQRAALDDSLWPELVSRLAAETGGSRAVMFTPTTAPQDGGFWASPDIEASHMGPYVSYYIQHDVWRQRAGLIMDGDQPMLGETVVSDYSLARTEFYNDFLKSLEIGRLLWAPVLPGDTLFVPGGMHLSIYRPLQAAAFDPKDATLLAYLLPHLRTAFATRHALRQATLGRYALEALETGIIIVDTGGRVLLMNESASRQVLDGHVLTITHGRLATPTEHGRAALNEFLAKLFQTAEPGKPPPHTLRITRPGADAALQLRGQPISEDGEKWSQIPRPAALLFLRNAQATTLRHDYAVGAQFGLSPTESWVALSLARGRTIQQLAAERGVSRETMRTHLKNIFDKTGCRRQADLVALVLAANTGY